MAKIKVSVRINDKMLLRLSKSQRQAANLTMEAVKRDIEKAEVVPRDIGKLEESVKVKTGFLDKGTVKISYNTPYARRLYYHPEYNFSQEENANAQGKWLETYISGEKEGYIKDTYEKIYKRLAGV